MESILSPKITIFGRLSVQNITAHGDIIASKLIYANNVEAKNKIIAKEIKTQHFNLTKISANSSMFLRPYLLIQKKICCLLVVNICIICIQQT